MRPHQVALAKVGLRALIDEATGFQEMRANDDLRNYARSVGLEQYLDLIEERIAFGLANAPIVTGPLADRLPLPQPEPDETVQAWPRAGTESKP